jgi:hypothetical protein
MVPSPTFDPTVSSDTPLVRIQGMTKNFGGVRALRGVSLEASTSALTSDELQVQGITDTLKK